MDLNIDDNTYSNLTNELKTLPKVNAPRDFETTLWRKINAETFEPRYKKEQWWEKFLVPSRLIPSASLALASIIILLVLNVSPTNLENPLVSQPRLRDAINNTSIQTSDSKLLAATPGSETRGGSVNSINSSVNSGNNEITATNLTASVNKSGFNFLQVKLSDTEKLRINALKERIKSYLNREAVK